MEMTKKDFCKVMEMDYLDALAVFAGLLEAMEDNTDAYNALYDFDDKAFKWAMQCEEEEKWMCIYTGLVYALELEIEV
jgi:hypothetical protein